MPVQRADQLVPNWMCNRSFSCHNSWFYQDELIGSVEQRHRPAESLTFQTFRKSFENYTVLPQLLNFEFRPD
jgi:hypothetical protein